MVKKLYQTLVILLALVSCNVEKEEKAEEIQQTQEPYIEYLLDKNHELGDIYSIEVAKVADYTKLPFAVKPIKKAETSTFDSQKVVLLNGTSNLSEQAIQTLIKFVAKGGLLIFTSVNEDERAGYLSGMKPNADLAYDLTSTGIKFKKSLLPGLAQSSIYPSKKNVGLDQSNLSKDISVLAVSQSDPNQPIIFSHRIGLGKVIHFNTSMIFEKQDRGLIFSMILHGLEGIPYPIVNANAIMLDDFPSPLYDVNSEPVYSELGRSLAAFVTKVWWPDMLKIADSMNLVYSAYPCFNYDKIKQAPFLFNEWDSYKINVNNRKEPAGMLLSKDIIKKGHELGIHGYNHESLLKEVWPVEEELIGSIKSLRKKWVVNGLGSYPTSYVAPSNDIDAYGLRVLKEQMPEIEFMATIYDGDFEAGGDREFDFDPLAPELFDFPRITSGYINDNFTNYTKESAFIYTGIWTHFVHPDDVYQLPSETNKSVGNYKYRNNDSRNWKTDSEIKSMSKVWTQSLADHKALHPGTPFLTTTAAATIARDWRQTDYDFIINDKQTIVKGRPKSDWQIPAYYWSVFVTNKNVESYKQQIKEKGYKYDLTPIHGGALFTIQTNTQEIILDSAPAQTSVSELDLEEKALSALMEYNRRRNQVATDFDTDNQKENDNSTNNRFSEEIELVKDSVVWLIANERIPDAIEILKRELIKSISYDSLKFGELIKYLGWIDESGQGLQLLDTIYQKSNTLALRYLSDYLSANFYENIDQETVWLKRQLLYDPANKLASNRLSDLAIESNDLKLIAQSISNSEGINEMFYAKYIAYLIENDSAKMMSELIDKQPENYTHLWPLATGIAYTFGDNKRIKDALMWGEYSEEIPLLTKLQWWADIQAYNKLYEEYENSKEGKNDPEVTFFVANIFYDLNDMRKASRLGDHIQESSYRDNFKKRLNDDIIYLDSEDQKFIIKETPDLLLPDYLQVITTNLRLNQNDYISFKSQYQFDNFEQSIWDNMASYFLRTKRLYTHSFSALHSYISDLQLLEEDINNVDHTLLGLGYGFQTKENTIKPLYSLGGKIWTGSRNDLFFGLNAGISQSNEKNFKSLSLSFEPVKTGPGLSRHIYKAEAIGYYERGATTKFSQTSLAMVGSQYTTNTSEIAFTGRQFFNLSRKRKSRISPFGEVFLSASNANQENGNPFWIIDQRLYAGGGAAWIFGRKPEKLNSRIEAGVFYDSFTKYFIRLNGQFSYPIDRFTYLIGEVEVFNQALYYSNAFSLGLRHHLTYRNFRYDAY